MPYTIKRPRPDMGIYPSPYCICNHKEEDHDFDDNGRCLDHFFGLRCPCRRFTEAPEEEEYDRT